MTLFKKEVSEAIGAREISLGSKHTYSEGESKILILLSSIWEDIAKVETIWEDVKTIKKNG